MKLTVIKPFSWAHQGIRIESFDIGQEIDTEDHDLIQVSTAEGWTVAEGHEAQPRKQRKTKE